MEKNIKKLKKERDTAVQPKEEGYVPRPKWQLWAARVGLVLFLLLVIAQIINLAGGRF